MWERDACILSSHRRCVPPFPSTCATNRFCGGRHGAIIGADLLHLKDFIRTTMGVASIGGAGTFDGIILSGILAAYLS
jgi:uncharacterized membrane protein